MNDQTATLAQIRKHYKDQGYEVRISLGGRVEFRRKGESTWLEGRWVDEYRIVEGVVVLK